MFSDIGPDVRWVGNESGVAGDPCWATFSPEQYAIGGTPGAILNRGIRDGSHWLPAEVDVSIRPGWFYHAREDGSVKSVERLMKLYLESVGRGCNLILNVPPDRRGRIHEKDAQASASGESDARHSLRRTWRGRRRHRQSIHAVTARGSRQRMAWMATAKLTGPATIRSNLPS